MCSSPRFHNYKDQGYCSICRDISNLFSQEPNVFAKSVLYMKHPQITEICTRKISSLTSKITGKTYIQKQLSRECSRGHRQVDTTNYSVASELLWIMKLSISYENRRLGQVDCVIETSLLF